jgi:hypothetical protein
MKPSHSRRTNDTPSRHPDGVPLGALLRRVVVLSTARPASHRGIPSLPVPGRRRVPSGLLLSAIFALGLFIQPSLAAAQPQLRWIAYVRAAPQSEYEYRGALTTVRSDGRGQRTLIEGGVLAVDLGPGGVVHAAHEQEPIGNHPPSSSLVTAWINKGMQEGGSEADSYYNGVAASSAGHLAISRQVTETQDVPSFLSEGLDDLQATTVPVLVPPEEPVGTEGLVPSAEEDSYHLLFTNDPAGELAHVEQINVLVTGTTGVPEPIPDPQSQQVSVRGTDGQFFCGASACFLTWQEVDATYTVGEFGAQEDATAFAESLVPIETVAGSAWREGPEESTPTPELIVRDTAGVERVLHSVEGFCECGFRPLDWNPGSDRLLVLASAEGYSMLQEYRADGSGEPATLAEDMDPEGLDVILDAAYGPEGVVALFGGEGGPPGTLRTLDSAEAVATDIWAFDIEGSTLAYVDAARDVIVRDLATGDERAVGHGAIDVSVAPDVIRAASTESTPSEDEGPSALLLALIAVGGVALLGGAAFFLIARRRRP